MPCYRCGARQTDPARGSSPWKRGVRADRQVLVCPGCQRAHQWQADLDSCLSCGSTYLVCRLGEVECRACGRTRPAEPATAGGPGTSGETGKLSEEVAEALDRVLGRLTRHRPA